MFSTFLLFKTFKASLEDAEGPARQAIRARECFERVRLKLYRLLTRDRHTHFQ